MASWVGLFGAVAVACGDSATGSSIPDPVDGPDGSTNKDAGGKTDGSVVVPPKDSSVPDTSTQGDTGVVTDGGLPTISTNVIDFGETDCGGTSTAQTFTISNPSSAAVSYTAELVKSAASPFTISPATGTIAGGGQVTVTVTPKAVPVPSTTAANGIGDTLKLSIGPTNTTIDLKQTAHGAVLRFSIPTGIDFGNTPLLAAAQESSFAVTNAGNATVPITLSIEPDATLDGGASPFTLPTNPTSAPPGFQTAKVAFAPTEVRAYNGAVKLTAGTGPLCEVAPANLTLKGSGTNGVIAVSPASISFGTAGSVDCNTTATPVRVKITNTSNAAVTYTASLAKTGGTSLYAVSIAPALPGTATTVTGSVAAAPPGGSTTVELILQPKAIPASPSFGLDFYADVLTVDTTGPTGATTNKVDLHQTARGATVARSVTGLNFGNVNAGTSSTQQYTFSNTGNVDITLALANALGNLPDGGAPPTAPTFTQPSFVTIPAGGFAVPTAQFNAPVRSPYPQTITDTSTLQQSGTGAPLCGTLPASLALQGVTVAPGTALSAASVAFGQVVCGTTAGTRPVRVTNNGPQVTYTLSLRKGGASPFTVSSTPIPVAPGAFTDVVITPKAIPQNLINVNDLTDTLDITPDDPSRSLVSVTLAITPQGAILTTNRTNPQSFGTTVDVSLAQQPELAFTLTNAGNIPLDATFTLTNQTPAASTAFTTSSNGPITVTNGGNSGNVPTLKFAPTTVGAHTALFRIVTTTVLCNAAVLDYNLTGTAIP